MAKTLQQQIFPEVQVTVEIPAGFVDNSYQHDEFPHWWNEDKNISLYILSDEAVENDGACKYQLCDESDVICDTNDWDIMLNFIKNYK